MRRLVALTLASFVGPIALSAQKPKKDKEKSHETQVTVVFSDTQRESARSYFVKEHGQGNCPPGLAKKHNGPARPRGAGEEALRRGPPTAAGSCCRAAPRGAASENRTRSSGYRYGILDEDSVKLAVGTLLVVDESKQWFGRVPSMSLQEDFNRSALSRVPEQANRAGFSGSCRYRLSGSRLSVAWSRARLGRDHLSIFPLSAGAFDVCYISAALGGPLSGSTIRARYSPPDPIPFDNRKEPRVDFFRLSKGVAWLPNAATSSRARSTCWC